MSRNLTIRGLLTKNEPIFYNPSPSSINYHSISFNSFFNSCSSLSTLKQIHALLVTNGSHLLLSTKLILSACKFAPSMDYARKLFDEMLETDVFLWNSLIRGYSNLGPCREALILYKKMHGIGLLPDNYTFPSVIRSCAVISAFREGKEVHCNVIKYGFVLDVFVQSSLISMYFQCGESLDSEMVFDEMRDKTIVSWTAMIAGYVQNKYFRKGLCVFREMVESAARPNAVTLVSILPACSGLEHLSLGMLVHCYAIKSGVETDLSLVNSLITLYGKCRNLEIARSLFNGIKVKNLVSWNTMLSVYEQNNDAKMAIKHFRRMETEKVDFDYITMIIVISACASLGRLNDGKWVHNIVKKKGFETSTAITNALIDMYAKCGNIDLARDVFEKLPNRRSVVSWTAIISAFASHGRVESALELFERMKEEGIRPNSFTFTAVLTACRHSGFVEEGRKHFNSMKMEYSTIPSVEHCACMVDLLSRAGCLMEAYEFIENMTVKADVGIWGALLFGCRIHGNLDLAEIVAERVFSLDSQTVTYYVLMSHIYAEAGRWQDAQRLKSMIEEKKLGKKAGYSSVEINRRFRTFVSG